MIPRHPSPFNCETLSNHPQGDKITSVLQAALTAADPGAAVHRHIQCDGSRLTVASNEYNLDQFRRVLVIGIGKGSLAMAQALVDILGERISGGVIVPKRIEDSPQPIGLIQVIHGDHPIPGNHSLQAAKSVIQALEGISSDDLILCPISGGGSALLAAPLEGISLSDLQALTSTLLACGATINEINILRKHLDRLKGGGLARMAYPARLVSLVLSDVVGSPLDIIASGPTVPDLSSYADAWGIIQAYKLEERLPASVIQTLQRGLAGKLPETPKPGDPGFKYVQNVIVGSNLQAAKAAIFQAQALGFNTLLLTTYLQGEAGEVGVVLAALLRQIAATGEPIPRPACIIAGGETTVTLLGSGMGGRNQELALTAVGGLSGLPDVSLISLATDGEDGPTDAAGAIVTGEMLYQAREKGIDPADFLSKNDSYNFFQPLNALLKPGSTGTNVNDLTFLFAF